MTTEVVQLPLLRLPVLVEVVVPTTAQPRLSNWVAVATGVVTTTIAVVLELQLLKAICGRCGLFVETTTTDRCQVCNARYDFVPFKMIEVATSDPAQVAIQPTPTVVALINREPDECEHGQRLRIAAPFDDGTYQGMTLTLDVCALWGEDNPGCVAIDVATARPFNADDYRRQPWRR